MATSPPVSQHARRMMRWMMYMGALVPSVIAVLSCFLLFVWLGDAPSEVAVHWDGSGAPDRFAPRGTYFLWIALAAWLIPVAITAAGLVTARRGALSFLPRAVAGIAVWLSALAAGIALGAAQIQRGLTHASEAPPIVSTIILAAIVALVAAVVAACLVPTPNDPPPETGTSIEPAVLAPGEVAAWTGTTSIPRWVMAANAIALGYFVLLAVIMPLGYRWVYLLLFAAVFGSVLFSSAYRVSVGSQGLVVRGFLGFPRLQVPLDEIVDVSVVVVFPNPDWGGRGWRVRPKATGVITRSGYGLQVAREDGTVAVVTIDDAHTAAGLLLALADRHMGGEAS